MTRQTIFAVFALAAMLIAAGCTPSASGANSATVSPAAQAENRTAADSPYSQPLMATGGDLVMLQAASAGIAG